MASGRDKNSLEYFRKEQREILSSRNYQMYENAPNGPANRTLLCGDGLGIGRIANRELSQNYTDIENELFGISANNWTQSKPSFSPVINTLPSLDIIDKPTVLTPVWPLPKEDQRLRMIHGGQTIRPRYEQNTTSSIFSVRTIS